jgi:hypothetical protein
MKLRNIFEIVFFVVAAILIFGGYFYFLPKHGEVVYNCSIAEISPDIPIKVKEECRKLRMDKIK